MANAGVLLDRPISVTPDVTPEMMTSISKVPAVTLVFWIIKILCTTIGETGGDAVTMSFLGETTENANPYGYLIGTGIFAVIFLIAVALQIKAAKFHPFLYWFTIIATTTVGTTLADYLTRSNGLGYTVGSSILLICVVASLVTWKTVTGTIDVASVRTPRSEIFYWVTIMFSQTLGTALGDWFADTATSGTSVRPGLWGRFARPGSALLLYRHIAGHTFLDRFYPDPPSRGGCGRFSRQTARGRRPRTKPLRCDGGITRINYRSNIVIPSETCHRVALKRPPRPWPLNPKQTYSGTV
jgi:hypothetical protein